MGRRRRGRLRYHGFELDSETVALLRKLEATRRRVEALLGELRWGGAVSDQEANDRVGDDVHDDAQDRD